MKVQIENPVLRGQSQDWVHQRVASVYEGAVGENFIVRIQSESGQGENNVSAQAATLIIQQVKEQLEKQKLSSDSRRTGARTRALATNLVLEWVPHNADTP
jgi:hypothetical protein